MQEQKVPAVWWLTQSKHVQLWPSKFACLPRGSFKSSVTRSKVRIRSIHEDYGHER